MATKNEANSVDDMTIGIGLINSPMIPDDKSNGKKAQTVVIVVVKIARRKSLQTNNPVSIGLNFPLR